MAVYTQLTNEQIAELLASMYDVGPLDFAVGITQGVENTNYLVATHGADGSEIKYILTLYEKRVNAADLPFFLGLMQHVAARGVAVPAPILRRDGALYGSFMGKQAALISFLHGQCRTVISEAHAAAVGEALGLLHLAGADFVQQRRNNLSFSGWQEIYRKISGRLDDIESGLEKLVQHELEFLAANLPAEGSLPSGVIHADLFPDNVFFEGDTISGLIDFYFACNDALAYDVAIALNAWCFDGKHQFSQQKSRLLLQHYQMRRKFAAAESAAFLVLLRGAALRFLLTRAHDWIHHDPKALVRPHDPREYAAKLRFHQGVEDVSVYGVF